MTLIEFFSLCFAALWAAVAAVGWAEALKWRKLAEDRGNELARRVRDDEYWRTGR